MIHADAAVVEDDIEGARRGVRPFDALRGDEGEADEHGGRGAPHGAQHDDDEQQRAAAAELLRVVVAPDAIGTAT